MFDSLQHYDCSPPGSSVHGIFQARILKWVTMPSSRRSSQPRDRTSVSSISCIGRQVLYHQRHLGSPYMQSTPSRMLGWMNWSLGFKITGRNISNLRCADDTTLMAESKEELKSLLIKVKEESEKAGLKLNVQKKIMASSPITSW